MCGNFEQVMGWFLILIWSFFHPFYNMNTVDQILSYSSVKFRLAQIFYWLDIKQEPKCAYESL